MKHEILTVACLIMMYWAVKILISLKNRFLIASSVPLGESPKNEIPPPPSAAAGAAAKSSGCYKTISNSNGIMTLEKQESTKEICLGDDNAMWIDFDGTSPQIHTKVKVFGQVSQIGKESSSGGDRAGQEDVVGSGDALLPLFDGYNHNFNNASRIIYVFDKWTPDLKLGFNLQDTFKGNNGVSYILKSVKPSRNISRQGTNGIEFEIQKNGIGENIKFIGFFYNPSDKSIPLHIVESGSTFQSDPKGEFVKSDTIEMQINSKKYWKFGKLMIDGTTTLLVV